MSKDFRETPLAFEDLVSVPKDEQEKICADFGQAEYLNFSELFVTGLVPEVILSYCRKQKPASGH